MTRRPPSLTVRLTGFFTLVAVVVLLGLDTLVERSLERHFQDLDRATLHDKVQLTQAVLAEHPPQGEWAGRLDGALAHHHGLYLRVQDAQGHTLYRTPGWQTPPPDAQGAPGGNDLLAWQDGERAYHGLQAAAHFADPSAPAVQLLVAIDTHHHTHFLAELQRHLIGYTVLATLASGLLGWLAARQGLRPLLSMRARAQGVTAQRLDQRMPEESVPVEMAQLAQALNRMLEGLQGDFQRLSDFASDLAHELRTPLSNLLTQTQVTLAQARDPATYRDTLASNAEELQRLARTVADMLTLAKTEHGVDLPHRERFDVAQEVRALFDFYEALAEDHQVTLRQHGDSPLTGDRLMFRRALSNLLSNALRHTPPGGEVRVDIQAEGAGCCVTVDNTGAEIPPEHLPHLFERFYRGAPAQHHGTEPDRTGLGLAITRAIVQAHGGRVSVSSRGGHTRFGLHFPGGNQNSTPQ